MSDKKRETIDYTKMTKAEIAAAIRAQKEKDSSPEVRRYSHCPRCDTPIPANFIEKCPACGFSLRVTRTSGDAAPMVGGQPVRLADSILSLPNNGEPALPNDDGPLKLHAPVLSPEEARKLSEQVSFCPKCHLQFKGVVATCKFCGTRLVRNVNKARCDFVGKESDYYEQLFRGFESGGEKATWNLFAMLFGGVWLAYRRNLTLGLVAISLQLLPFALGVNVFISAAVAVLINLCVAAVGNMLYYKRICRILDKYNEKESVGDTEAAYSYFSANNGPCILNMIIALIYIAGGITAIIIFLM